VHVVGTTPKGVGRAFNTFGTIFSGAESTFVSRYCVNNVGTT